MNYAVRMDQKDEATIIMEDGGYATLHHNGEHIITTYYQNRVELFTFNYRMWNLLDSGIVYVKDWHTKQDIDSEAIQDALQWLCVGCGDSFTEIPFQELVDNFNLSDLSDINQSI